MRTSGYRSGSGLEARQRQPGALHRARVFHSRAVVT